MQLQPIINMLSPLFQSSAIPISVVDADGKYVYFNNALVEIADQLRDQDNPNLRVKQGSTTINKNLLRSIGLGKPFTNRTDKFITRKGDELVYRYSTTPLIDRNDRTIGGVSIITSWEVAVKNGILDNGGIIHQSSKMQEIIKVSHNIARANVPTIIYGETGTGKELFAHLIHNQSARKDKPFLAVNCAALPEDILESTMFGTQKGAFTGSENNPGLIELAEGGTLFLDELNSMPINIQPKLLRFLQDGTYWRVGGAKECKSDVRIITAINTPPMEAIDKNLLRQDLYYRLCVGYISIPPLRERKEDIPLLVKHFIDKHRHLSFAKIEMCTPETLQFLIAQEWIGNVRMLETAIIRAIIAHTEDGPLSTQFDHGFIRRAKNELPDGWQASKARKELPGEQAVSQDIPELKGSLTENIERYEHKLIKEAFHASRGSVSKTARQLGLKRSTLQYKLKRHNLC